ncbi:MAG: hypoxanthine phosphoribosyltransferase [Lachnospiraceae bacterium]|nr:hypoxanthine phosphoribosyltransferase [Lachnospiraceae bacterium]
METVETVSVMISEERLLARVREMAEQITADFAGCDELKLVCILKGSVFFTTELAKRINLPIKLDFMSVSSYGDDMESSGRVRIVKDLDETIRGQNVIVVEDIVDSGRTLAFLLEMLRSRQPETLRLCTLLDKPSRRVTDVKVDYTGFEIPDEFVVGFGLDYAQKYRALPFIGKLSITDCGEDE